MKNLFYLLIICVCFSSCDHFLYNMTEEEQIEYVKQIRETQRKEEERRKEKELKVKVTKKSEFYKIIEIEGCEYVQTVYDITHKGNCKYCIKRNENK